jgi:hypothetical protein
MMGNAKEKERQPPCEACHGRGWLLSFNMDRGVYEVQRCDACARYDSDEAAGDDAVPMLEAALAMADLMIENARRMGQGNKKGKGKGRP